MARDTKTRIVDVALTLFNEGGTDNVTTNHIAEAMGISPGNFYYHFRNKSEIVRELFARIQAAWAENYSMPPGTFPSIAMMEKMLAGNFDIQARYLFFFRDLTLLLNSDADLAAAYRASRESGLSNARLLISLFADAGILRPAESEEALEDIAELLWFVGDFWLVFKDTGGAAFGTADKDQGIRLFRRILNPYLKGPSP